MSWTLPDVDDAVVHFIRAAYGVLLLATLLSALPHARRFFQSERWGGYARSSRAVDLTQGPRALPIILALWIGSAVLLIAGVWSIAAALVNVALCRYFFVWMRWRGVLRGMGAPGFMTYWLGVAVLLLELATELAAPLRPLVLAALQIDLAFVFLAAAIYKLRSGYLSGRGLELGLLNPEWGYWWPRWLRLAPGHPIFRLLDHLAWSTELVAAVAMLVPATRYAGGLLLIVSFVFIGTQIRLGWLAPMVMLSGALFFAPGTAGARLVAEIPFAAAAAGRDQLPGSAMSGIAFLIAAYLVLLPIVYGGLALNLYGRRRLPASFQAMLDGYANLFGIILWRVFSADIVGFFVRVSTQDPTGTGRALIFPRGDRPKGRFAHVGEMITLTSVFTTPAYYPSAHALFEERLLRYARTLPCPTDRVLVFEHVSIREQDRGFAFVSVTEYVVDPRASTITERALVAAEDAEAPGSSVYEAARPGSYAPRM